MPSSPSSTRRSASRIFCPKRLIVLALVFENADPAVGVRLVFYSSFFNFNDRLIAGIRTETSIVVSPRLTSSHSTV